MFDLRSAPYSPLRRPIVFSSRWPRATKSKWLQHVSAASPQWCRARCEPSGTGIVGFVSFCRYPFRQSQSAFRSPLNALSVCQIWNENYEYWSWFCMTLRLCSTLTQFVRRKRAEFCVVAEFCRRSPHVCHSSYRLCRWLGHFSVKFVCLDVCLDARWALHLNHMKIFASNQTAHWMVGPFPAPNILNPFFSFARERFSLHVTRLRKDKHVRLHLKTWTKKFAMMSSSAWKKIKDVNKKNTTCYGDSWRFTRLSSKCHLSVLTFATWSVCVWKGSAE